MERPDMPHFTSRTANRQFFFVLQQHPPARRRRIYDLLQGFDDDARERIIEELLATPSHLHRETLVRALLESGSETSSTAHWGSDFSGTASAPRAKTPSTSAPPASIPPPLLPSPPRPRFRPRYGWGKLTSLRFVAVCTSLIGPLAFLWTLAAASRFAARLASAPMEPEALRTAPVPFFPPYQYDAVLNERLRDHEKRAASLLRPNPTDRFRIVRLSDMARLLYSDVETFRTRADSGLWSAASGVLEGTDWDSRRNRDTEYLYDFSQEVGGLAHLLALSMDSWSNIVDYAIPSWDHICRVQHLQTNGTKKLLAKQAEVQERLDRMLIGFGPASVRIACEVRARKTAARARIQSIGAAQNASLANRYSRWPNRWATARSTVFRVIGSIAGGSRSPPDAASVRPLRLERAEGDMIELEDFEARFLLFRAHLRVIAKLVREIPGLVAWVEAAANPGACDHAKVCRAALSGRSPQEALIALRKAVTDLCTRVREWDAPAFHEQIETLRRQDALCGGVVGGSHQ